MKFANFYTLRQVADLTGLSEFTLRGWEGRYNAFTPNRSETGRRQYTKVDLKKAFLLRELTQSGHRIGDIARCSNSILEKKLDHQNLATDSNHSKTLDNHNHHDNIESVMKLALLQDWNRLKVKLSELIQKKNTLAAVQEVILPLLARLVAYVASHRLGIAQEHILSALIKEQLYILISKVPSKQKKVKGVSVVIATPEGDYHELGILVAHVILAARGVNSLYLGVNAPKNELCETAIRFGASHILLASTISRRAGVNEDVFSYVHYLDQHLPRAMDLWIGGRNFEQLNLKLNRNVTLLKSLNELSDSIQHYQKTK